MNILAISDVHGNENNGLYSYLNNNNVDLLIISGDITNFGPVDFVEYFMNKLSNHGTKIFAVPGNCDPDDVEGKIIDSNAICIHDNVVEYENLVIYGFGGSNPTPFDTPGEVDEETLYKSIKKVLDSKDINLVKESSDEFPNGRISILVTHAPPKNTEADKIVNGSHVGSESVRKIIEEYKPRLNICGHIHEARSMDMLDDTIIINPGMLEHGHGCLIEIDENNNIIANFVNLD
ncbi:3',5'-cyclic adenosine monophosphate phosphodiesterase CpdA [bioreactor metagenome]|uniref:3',5'-cyclic adenosine monophosphate phosphodiesterase CpdA n=1 Tax=bioreactor metagenome TaxID=1076179 RepID=A0A644U9I2_9ZZZZ|nr:metallophosphoesterase [Methanobrevibacter sp.]MEA4956748.1 metallophosphoesterase [Methanobrevibacter sp.]